MTEEFLYIITMAALLQVLFLRYYDTGELFCEEEYKEGYQEGWFRSYHKNGKKYTEYKAHNNVEYDGIYKKWDENGNLMASF
ncbi:hypothetical protein EMIT036CA2_30347 [Chryseobacterium sp. IT-36CA2]